MVKLYRNLGAGVAEALLEIFGYHRHAAQVVETFLTSNKKWGARDRNFVAATVYECVRYYRRYLFLVDINGIQELQHAWMLLGAHLWEVHRTLPDWPEFQLLNVEDFKLREKQMADHRAICESVPDWLDTLCQAELGNRWQAELQALNQPAKLCLRINTLRSSRTEIEKFLSEKEIPFSVSPLSPLNLIIDARKNIRSWEIYQNGSVEIQDVASQLIAPLLRPEKGQILIDACAGAGGKSLQLAAAIENEGRILSIDVHANKLEELDRRARRAGASCITAHLSKEALLEKWKGKADRLLIDAPCSGLGTIKRHPDLKWKLTPDFLNDMKITQRHVLATYAPLLKPGGLLVYATCSILPSENAAQADWFLSQFPGYSKQDELKLFPSETGFDGFYACAMQLD